MKISVITVVYNSADTVQAACDMIAAQYYADVEWIVIDGGSTDRTLEVLRAAQRQPDFLISEPDEGIYDALNKGLQMATGEIVGLLHSDDFYPDRDVLCSVAKVFDGSNVDVVYGDLEYIKEVKGKSYELCRQDRGGQKSEVGAGLDFKRIQEGWNESGRFRVVRRWVSGAYDREKFKKGWMPPHPSLYIRRQHYEMYGLFDLQYKIAADYDMMIRHLWKNELEAVYLPKVLMRMRVGGASNGSLTNILRKLKEDYRVIKSHGLSLRVLMIKNVSKISQFFKT